MAGPKMQDYQIDIAEQIPRRKEFIDRCCFLAMSHTRDDVKPEAAKKLDLLGRILSLD